MLTLNLKNYGFYGESAAICAISLSKAMNLAQEALMRLGKWRAAGLRVNYAGVSEFTDSGRGVLNKESRPCFPAQKTEPKTSKYPAQVVAGISEPCAGERKSVFGLNGLKDGYKAKKSRASAVGAGTTIQATCVCRTVTTRATRTRIGTTIMAFARQGLLDELHFVL